MGTKQVRLDDDVYAKIEDLKREGESFSDAIDRLTSDFSLAEWGERHEWSTERTENHRERANELAKTNREELEETLAMLESAGDDA